MSILLAENVFVVTLNREFEKIIAKRTHISAKIKVRFKNLMLI